MKQRTALLSVYNKEGIADFARELVNLGWKIISSGGTAKHLSEAGIPVADVADLTGLPPILSHRVVTLHPKIHGGILASDTSEHHAELEQYGIPFIDMVCCDLYPLEEEVSKKEATWESVIEKTDIGGPTMIRAAAKGRRIVIAEVDDRQRVIDWLKAGEPEREKFLNDLAAKAEIIISRYCALSAGFHSEGFYKGLSLKRVAECAYGENAWQKPAYLNKRIGNDDKLALHNWIQIAGNAPSFNNWCDIDRMLQTMTHIGAGFEKNFSDVPLIAIGVKHGNACGVGVGGDKIEVIDKMLLGDLRAIFGGLVMLNFPVDKDIADELIHRYTGEGRRLLDVVAAPSFTKEAIEILSRKKGKCRLMANLHLNKAGIDTLDVHKKYRYVRGGFLEQPNYTFLPAIASATEGVPKSILKDVILAWAVGSTSNSNTITIVKEGRLYGNGVGQQDRVGAAKLAILRADEANNGKADLQNAVAYSDSFFPFPDALEVLIERGVKTIFSTSGSINDEKIVELCKSKGVNLIMLPDTEARGFFQH